MKGLSSFGIIAVVLVFAFLVYGFSSGMISLPQATINPNSNPDNVPSSIHCIGGETQSLDLNSYDVDTPTTALTESHNIYRELGSVGSLGTLTEGTAITGLSTGNSYEFLYGVDATASNRYDNAYGPHLTVSSLPCRLTKNIALFQDEVEGSLSATFYNSNHDASAETLVASTPVEVSLKWYGANKEYYGNPYVGEASYLGLDWNAIKQSGVNYVKGVANGNHRPQYPNVLCLQLNSTNHNQPEYVKAKLQNGNIVEMNRVSTPSIHAAAAGHIDYCYEAPVISGQFIEFIVKLDPKAGVDLDDDVASLYASSWFTNTDTGSVQWGPEDNDGNAIGASNPDTLALDFTA